MRLLYATLCLLLQDAEERHGVELNQKDEQKNVST